MSEIKSDSELNMNYKKPVTEQNFDDCINIIKESMHATNTSDELELSQRRTQRIKQRFSSMMDDLLSEQRALDACNYDSCDITEKYYAMIDDKPEDFNSAHSAIDLFYSQIGIDSLDNAIERGLRGDIQAQIILGHHFRYGIGTGKDISRSYYWYRKAETTGNLESSAFRTQLYKSIDNAVNNEYDRIKTEKIKELSGNGIEPALAKAFVVMHCGVMPPQKKVCVVCGNIVQGEVESDDEPEYSDFDLDFRPCGSERDGFKYSVEVCPRCHYIAKSISTAPIVISEDGLKLENMSLDEDIMFFKGRDSQIPTFYRKYLISMISNDIKSAVYDLLFCAWQLDDDRDSNSALQCREKALDLIDMLPSELENDQSLPVIRVDMLRRTRQYSRLLREIQLLRETKGTYISSSHYIANIARHFWNKNISRQFIFAFQEETVLDDIAFNRMSGKLSLSHVDSISHSYDDPSAFRAAKESYRNRMKGIFEAEEK